jgi:hypothetical protein
MSEEPEHSRVRTVLDDVAEANTARTMERLAQKAQTYSDDVLKHIKWADTDPRWRTAASRFGYAG